MEPEHGGVITGADIIRYRMACIISALKLECAISGLKMSKGVSVKKLAEKVLGKTFSTKKKALLAMQEKFPPIR